MVASSNHPTRAAFKLMVYREEALCWDLSSISIVHNLLFILELIIFPTVNLQPAVGRDCSLFTYGRNDSSVSTIQEDCSQCVHFMLLVFMSVIAALSLIPISSLVMRIFVVYLPACICSHFLPDLLHVEVLFS